MLLHKLKKISVLFFGLIAISANADDFNSQRMFIDSIESRGSGLHDIYFSGEIPNQNCSLQNRAVLVETDAGGKTMFSVLLSAFISKQEVVIRVEGCQEFRPHITKVQVFRD